MGAISFTVAKVLARPLKRLNSAMRDAAAKFLVQFPEQPTGRQLARNEVVVPDKPESSAEAALIEAVPIDEPADEPTPPKT